MVKLASAAVVMSLLAGGAAQAAAPSTDMPAFSAARDDVSVMLWLRRNTSLGPGQSVVFGDDSVLVVTADLTEAGRPNVHRVSFRQEATKIDFVSRTGGRSLKGAADIDCTTGQVRSQGVTLYSGQDLKGGEVLSQGADTTFRAPVYGSASALVTPEVCRQRRPTAQIASAPPPIPPRPAPVQAPAPAPTPVEPPSPPRAPIAQAELPPPPPPPAPAPAPAPEPRRPSAPAQPAQPGVVAQIGAFSSADAAQAAWDKLVAQFPAELAGKTVRVEPAQVNGQQVFRTSVEGFESEAAARSTCGELMARSQACFVRRAP